MCLNVVVYIKASRYIKNIPRSAEGLPNIWGQFPIVHMEDRTPYSTTSLFSLSGGANSKIEAQGHEDTWNKLMTFNASIANTIYGNSTTVQPPARVVNFFIKY